MNSTEFTLFSQKFKPWYLPVKNKNQKISFIPYFTLDKLSNDTSLNSLRWIHRSAKIDWTKQNPFEYVVPTPPLKRGRNNKPSSFEAQTFQIGWFDSQRRSPSEAISPNRKLILPIFNRKLSILLSLITKFIKSFIRCSNRRIYQISSLPIDILKKHFTVAFGFSYCCH